MTNSPPAQYEIQLPVTGRSGEYWTVVRAETPEGAAECVRVILAQHDPEIREVTVRVGVRL